jgi:hypothetical protein
MTLSPKAAEALTLPSMDWRPMRSRTAPRRFRTVVWWRVDRARWTACRTGHTCAETIETTNENELTAAYRFDCVCQTLLF